MCVPCVCVCVPGCACVCICLCTCVFLSLCVYLCELCVRTCAQTAFMFCKCQRSGPLVTGVCPRRCVPHHSACYTGGHVPHRPRHPAAAGGDATHCQRGPLGLRATVWVPADVGEVLSTAGLDHGGVSAHAPVQTFSASSLPSICLRVPPSFLSTVHGPFQGKQTF